MVVCFVLPHTPLRNEVSNETPIINDFGNLMG